MKFPSRLLVPVLVAAFAIPAVFAQTPAAKTPSASAKKAKGKISPKRVKAIADSLRKIDSIEVANSLRLDSIRFSDSLRKSSPAYRNDSTHGSRAKPSADSGKPKAQTDSARIADSLLGVAEASRRADSVARAARTWFVAHPRDFSRSPGFVAQLQTRLEREIRRTAKVSIALQTDTGSSFANTWNQAKTSGAGKMLYSAVYAGSKGGRNAIAWIFDLSDGRKLDSAHAENAGAPGRQAADLASVLVASLLPSNQDSICRADSAALANSAWALAEPRADGLDSAIGRAVRDSLAASLKRAGRVSWRELAITDTGCRKRHCIDSAAHAAGIAQVVHSIVSRQSDSTWVLSAWVARTGDDSLVDFLRVTDTVPSALAARAAGNLLPASPASCRDTCPAISTRTVWSFHLSTDYSSRPLAARTAAALKSAFRARTDRQFLALPDPLAPVLDTAHLDSTARALGVRKLALFDLSGTDSSARSLRVQIRDLNTNQQDTQLFRRCGPVSRLLPWFVRHASSLETAVAPCGDGCRSDSLRRSLVNWALVPTVEADSVPGKPIVGGLSRAFSARATGKLVALPEALPCGDLPCIDSAVAPLSVKRLVWPAVSREKDSTLVLSAWISDPDADLWIDSLELRDSGSLPEAFDRLSARLWDSLAPRRSCDSCVSTDTLEAGLAVVAPDLAGVSDSLRKIFRDAFSRTLSTEGAYQILNQARTDSLLGQKPDSAALGRLHCRLGAAFILRSGAILEKSGWHMTASILEIATGKTIASVDYQDGSSRLDRPSQLAPWIAHRLLGASNDSTAAAAIAAGQPPPPNKDAIPWFKILALAIPLTIGAVSVYCHM
jgi:hypothetical protein